MNALFNLLLTSTALVAPAPVTPSVGTVTVLKLDTASDTAVYSTTHTRAVGAGLHWAGFYRSNSSNTPDVTSVTFGGVGMTSRAQDTTEGANDLGCAVFSMDPGTGPTGAQTLEVTLSATAARDFLSWVADVLNTSGFEASTAAAQSTEDAGATTESVAVVPANAASLLVSVGGCLDGSGTVAAGSGFTEVANDASATDANAVEGVLQTKAPGATSSQTVAIDTNAARTDRVITCGEWLPT